MFQFHHLKLRCRARKWENSIKVNSQIKQLNQTLPGKLYSLGLPISTYMQHMQFFISDLPPKLSSIWTFSFKYSISVQHCQPECTHLAFIFSEMQLLTQTLSTKMYSLGLPSFCIQTAVSPNGQLFCRKSPRTEELLLEQN